MQDYRSLCAAAATICATVGNIQIHRQTDTQTDTILTSLSAYMNSSAN